MKMTRHRRLALWLAVLGVFMTLCAPALAGKHASASGGSLTLVPLYTHPGGPMIGDPVTFSVSTSASFPYVAVSCYQGKALVYSQSNGFFAGYPWGQTFQLGPTSVWASGSAACRAVLTSSGSTLASISFSVAG
jgi:hypothetical protein